MQLLIILSVMALAVAGKEDSSDDMIQLCGANLYTGLVHACEHARKDMLDSKQVEYHHHSGYQHHDKHDHQHNHLNDDQDDSQTGHPKRRVKKRSIVEDCCEKPCHIEEFLSYCSFS